MIKVITYTTDTGKEPFSDWLDDLDIKSRNIVITRIARVRLGNFGDCKLLKDAQGLWELRIDFGPGYRVYFGKNGNTIVVLLVGGSKGSQSKDIAKAKRYWALYQEEL